MEAGKPPALQQQDIQSAFSLADKVVYKTYLETMNAMMVQPCPEELEKKQLNDIVRFFKVERFVSEKNENNRDKLVSVFHTVAKCGGSVIVLIHSDGAKISYHFGTKNQNSKNLYNSAEALEKTLKGNFPGTNTKPITEGAELNGLLNQVFLNTKFKGQEKHICTITGIAGLRSKEESHEKLFVQGMEKLIDSMKGEKYTLLLIADPVSSEELQITKRGYEKLYSLLVPFAGSELNFEQNESENVSNSITEGLFKTINKSVTDTLTYMKGTSTSHTKGNGDTVGVGIGTNIPFVANAGLNHSHLTNESDTDTTNESTAKARAITESIAYALSLQKGVAIQKSKGTSQSIQLKSENKSVKNLMEKIDLQLKRLDTSGDIGMWNCSMYCLADTASVCKITASAYQSLLRGENSSVESGVITEWSEENVKAILPYLEKMHHPKLKLGEDCITTPSSLINSAELTIHAGIPQSSVGGLPVLEMASFGREVSAHWESGEDTQYGNKIELGKIYHMGKQEELPVTLNKNSLASHTFITGSTGSGKSNTVYSILDRADIPFLVIEPAKGEYKHAFGGKKDVSVYGTNPDLTMLLRINPFKFNKGIHILEHLDRLIEIFNVCWPMYAAMPAVLKEAVERSYQQVGWDLQTSKNRYDDTLFPTFKDVCANILSVINVSEYSEENKGNYKGALVTRLNSLTNGINGMIFTADDLSDKELFDKQVIVDLSRVGSIETKALIMGLLIMKLQEYRMTAGKIDAPLHHITVLEEAHNLLKRTSTEQSSETANLLGKSVEMLANAIAEMRTYGEGFIIADQAPGLLDMSVIRNTNTKIILRLPDESDRVLVGKAAGLNDDQIGELAKLQRGVAAVYQNDWIQPVLCKVPYFEKPKERYKPAPEAPPEQADSEETAALKKSITEYLLSHILHEPQEFDAEKTAELRKTVLQSNLSGVTKTRLCDFLAKNTPPKTIEPLVDIIGGMYHCPAEIIDTVIPGTPVSGDWANLFNTEIYPAIQDFSWEQQKYIMQCVALKESRENARLKDLPIQLQQVI